MIRQLLSENRSADIERVASDSADKEIFGQLKSQRASKENLKDSLVLLTRMMSAHYGKQVILLVDEYDVPLAKASENGYYTEMMDVLRALLGGALKTNEFLKFAVITGCLKIVKESIFTGINNLVADTITGGRFEEYFGFSEADVEKMLRDTGLTEYASVFKEWYDGYRFGKVDVYCPWDVLNYANALQDDAHAQPQAYWANTSGNYILRSFLRRASRTTKKEIEALISGETVTQKISEQLTYNELDKNISNLWSVLYMTGYLTAKGKTTDGRLELCIPNREIWEIFSLQIQEWFEEDVVKKEAAAYEAFCQAFAEGKAQEIENEFNRFLLKSISIRDTFVQKAKKENFYHGILLGMLMSREDWFVRSNSEDGEGYSDIHVEIEDRNTAFVIEVKYAEMDALEEG